MPVNDFELFQNGQARASELKRLAKTTEANSRLAGVGGATVRRNSGGIEVTLSNPVVFWAKITGNNAGSPAAHSWTEQGEPGTSPPLTDATDARTGTTTVFPAYAIDGGIVPNGHIVRLYLSTGGDYYLFDPGMAGSTGSTLTVEELNGSATSVPNVTDLQFDHADGFVITSIVSHFATVNIAAASTTQRGIVSLADQELGAGSKRFAANVVLGYTGEILFNNNGFSVDSDSVRVFGGGISPDFNVVLGGAAAVDPTYVGLHMLYGGGAPKIYAVGSVMSTGTVGAGFGVHDSVNSIDYIGINGTGFTSVNVQGGIVVAGSSGGSATPFASDLATYTYAGGL